MQLVARDPMAQVSYQGVKIFYPMGSPYDRQMLADHIVACSRHASRVDVEIGDHHWVLQRAALKRAQCPDCGGPLATACAAPSRSLQICVRCAIEDSAAGTSSPPAEYLTM